MTLRKCKYCKKKVEQLQINIPQVCKAKECIQSYYDEYSEKVNAKARWNILKAKADQHKEEKESLKTHKDHLKDLQKVFNEFIRKRDESLPCVSCGTFKGQMHCGHYMAVSVKPQLRFNEFNTAKQCARCNNYLSANLINYRIELIKRIGLEKVEELENDNSTQKLSIPEIKEFIKNYKIKIHELKIKR